MASPNDDLIPWWGAPPEMYAGPKTTAKPLPGKQRAGQTGKPGGLSAYDPFGDLFGYGMGLLNEQGTPGSGGGMVSQAALRAALQNAYGQSEGDRSNVYGQVDAEIRGRDTDIEAWASARTVTRGRPKKATS